MKPQEETKNSENGVYEVELPVSTTGSLMLYLSDRSGHTVFTGYQRLPNNEKGSAEAANLIQGVGDRVMSINGQSTDGMTFDQIVEFIRSKAKKSKFIVMRLLHTKGDKPTIVEHASSMKPQEGTAEKMDKVVTGTSSQNSFNENKGVSDRENSENGVYEVELPVAATGSLMISP